MKKYRFWLIEILVWISIVSFLSFIFIKWTEHQKELHSTGHVFFADTDGLIVGSPVRFMGVQVGYVSNVSIVNSEAYVSFVITEKNLKLPQGTIATVEFSGLAGSKSLELSPPNAYSLSTGYSILAVEPIRINSFVHKQQEIATNIINVTNQLNLVITKNNILQIKTFLNTTELFKNLNYTLDNINSVEEKTLLNIKNRMEQRTKNGK